MKYLLKLKDLEIPFCIKNYKTAKTIKIYFKEDCLTITKSPYIPKREVDKMLRKNENMIYEEYKKILERKKLEKGKWEDGNITLYHGEEYSISKTYHNKDVISVRIDTKNKIFNIFLPNQIQKEEEEYWIKKAINKLFKENTEVILQEKLPYWSKKTNISYNNVKVRDAKTKYGSCKPKTKDLNFSSRLVMLKKEAIDAIVVHELCHIVYPNHSKEFYELVKKYIPNYKEIDKYLKSTSKLTMR